MSLRQICLKFAECESEDDRRRILHPIVASHWETAIDMFAENGMYDVLIPEFIPASKGDKNTLKKELAKRLTMASRANDHWKKFFTFVCIEMEYQFYDGLRMKPSACPGLSN